jgi:hypothetical protein
MDRREDRKRQSLVEKLYHDQGQFGLTKILYYPVI